MDDNIDIRPLPKVKFVEDEANASKILGNTAYYDPQNCAITLYITDRHPKDILRSFAHEMIHHMQNMQGRLNNIGTQNINQDDNLKGLEKEAYELGNILLRSWENSQDQINEAIIRPTNTGVGVMPLTTREKEWIEDKLYDFSRTENPPTDPDLPVEYAFITRDIVEDDIDWGLSTPEDLELFNSIYRKLKYKIYTLNLGFDPKINKYPQEYDLRDSVVRADSDKGMPELTVIWSDRQDSVDSTFGAFDKDTGEYIKYSDLDNIGKVDEARILPTKTGIGKKINIEFHPDDSNVKSIEDIHNKLQNFPRTTEAVMGAIKTKDSENFPPMFVEIYLNKQGELTMDLESNSNYPENYDVWEEKLQKLHIPFIPDEPFMSDINIDKYFKITVKPK